MKTVQKSSQAENKTNHLEKNIIDVYSLTENKKELMRNNKRISKTQQGVGMEKHDIFTKQINKIALSLNDDKRIESIYSIGVTSTLGQTVRL